LRRVQGETLAFVRYFFNDPDEMYAHGASVEVYNSPQYDYLEIEVHAPLIKLLPAATRPSQVWRVGRIKGIVGPDEVEKVLGEQVSICRRTSEFLRNFHFSDLKMIKIGTL